MRRGMFLRDFFFLTRDLQAAQLQDRELLAVYQQTLQTEGNLFAVLFLPHRNTTQTYGIVGVLETERRERRHENFSQLHASEGWARAQNYRRPKQVPETLGWLHLQ